MEILNPSFRRGLHGANKGGEGATRAHVTATRLPIAVVNAELQGVLALVTRVTFLLHRVEEYLEQIGYWHKTPNEQGIDDAMVDSDVGRSGCHRAGEIAIIIKLKTTQGWSPSDSHY